MSSKMRMIPRANAIEAASPLLVEIALRWISFEFAKKWTARMSSIIETPYKGHG